MAILPTRRFERVGIAPIGRRKSQAWSERDAHPTDFFLYQTSLRCHSGLASFARASALIAVDGRDVEYIGAQCPVAAAEQNVSAQAPGRATREPDRSGRAAD
jgi:hypothetical protein